MQPTKPAQLTQAQRLAAASTSNSAPQSTAQDNTDLANLTKELADANAAKAVLQQLVFKAHDRLKTSAAEVKVSQAILAKLAVNLSADYEKSQEELAAAQAEIAELKAKLDNLSKPK